MGKKIFKYEGKLEEEGEKYITNIEIKYTMVSFLFSCIPALITIFFTEETDTFLRYTGVEWGWVIFMAFISSAIGLFVFFIGVRKIEVSKGMSLALLKPIMASALAFAILSETPTNALITSIVLVIVAVTLINRKSKIEMPMD